MKPTPEYIEPVAWWWLDSHECVYVTMDRPDVEDVAATVGSSPMPLYDATALSAAEERGRLAERERCVRVRHKKRGTTYEVIGVGKMQAEDWMVREFCGADEPVNGPSVDMREVTIYRSTDDGSLWVRPVEEFNDGRFEAITKEPTP